MTEHIRAYASPWLPKCSADIDTTYGTRGVDDSKEGDTIFSSSGHTNAVVVTKGLCKSISSKFLGSLMILLTASILTLVPKQVDASSELAAIAAAVSIVEKLISLSDSDGDEVSRAVSENQELLLKLHERLDGYDDTFGTILEKLDELPDEFQERFDKAFDVDQMRKVRGIIQLIHSDLRIREETAIDPTSRLGDLQSEAQTLLNHTSDFIFLDALAAMFVEQAVIGLQSGFTNDELQRMIENRRRDYHSRFKDMLLPWEVTKGISGKKSYESLPEVRERAESSLARYIEEMDSIISRDATFRTAYYSFTSDCGLYQCYGICYERYTLLDKKVQDVQEQFRKTVEATGYVERALLLYRNMWNAIRHELGEGDEDLEKEHLGDIAQRYEDEGRRLKLFGVLDKGIVEEGACPHG